jgi:hypothetical protein
VTWERQDLRAEFVIGNYKIGSDACVAAAKISKATIYREKYHAMETFSLIFFQL